MTYAGLPSTVIFFFSSRRRHTRCSRDWSSDVCSSDLFPEEGAPGRAVLLTLRDPGDVVRRAALDPPLQRAAPFVVARSHHLEARQALLGRDAAGGDRREQRQIERVVLAMVAERIGLRDLHLTAEAPEP